MTKKKLKHQIILLCVFLVLLTCITLLTIFWWFGNRYTDNHIQQSVTHATNVFEQYSATKSDLLATAAQVLTADFGFKQAVATRDKATINSALENHSERINADFMLITDLNGQFITSNSRDLKSSPETQEQIQYLMTHIGKTHFIAIENALYQTIALPVKAPRTIAFAIVGFAIDTSITLELKSLTTLEISFFLEDTLLTTSITNESTDQLWQNQTKWMIWSRPKFRNISKHIPSNPEHPITVLLSNNLTDFYLSFDQLIVTVITLAMVIINLAIAASFLLANSLTVPLARLVNGVHQFAKGNYTLQRFDERASTEIQTLITAFGNMGCEIEKRETRILHQAQHDLLTDLYNRNAMLHHIDLVIHKQTPFILVVTHIRNLQEINDNLGFDIGDNSLCLTSSRLSTFLEPHHAFHGRIEGNSLISLVPNQDKENALTLLEKLLHALHEPLEFQAIKLALRCQIGLVSYPHDGENAKDLVRRAMIAADNARIENTGLRLYHSGEDEAHLNRLSIIEDLKNALSADDGQLYMNYQPKQNLSNHKIEKLEALIRWQRPNHGFIPPDYFIDLAEKAGLIVELTHWVIDSVLKQLKTWLEEGLEIQVAINVSAQDLNHPDFLPFLQAAVATHNIPPKLVTLELTERDLMSDEAQGISLMEQLRNAGYILSVDDYGIGQSSLSKLKQLPVHELKIDKSFILTLDESPTDQMIVRSTIELGHKLELSVVAEGVENESSLNLLRQMGCDYIQGYFLAKPLPANQVSQWLIDYDSVRKQA